MTTQQLDIFGNWKPARKGRLKPHDRHVRKLMEQRQLQPSLFTDQELIEAAKGQKTQGFKNLYYHLERERPPLQKQQELANEAAKTKTIPLGGFKVPPKIANLKDDEVLRSKGSNGDPRHYFLCRLQPGWSNAIKGAEWKLVIYSIIDGQPCFRFDKHIKTRHVEQELRRINQDLRKWYNQPAHVFTNSSAYPKPNHDREEL